MSFYNTVIIIALILLIILLMLFGVFIGKFTDRPFPYTQDSCPKLWNMDICGNCLNPVDASWNTLPNSGDWTSNTPGYVPVFKGGFNPKNQDWETYDGAKNQICGKQKWSKKYEIDWNGVTTYNDC